MHGLKGILSIYSHTHPRVAIGNYTQWRVGFSMDTSSYYTVGRCWAHGQHVLANLEGIHDRNQAETFKGQKIWIDRADVPEEDDAYLWEDLVGCQVCSGDVVLGSVTALQDFGAQEILVVESLPASVQQGEWLLPFTHEIILNVNIETRRIDVDLPDGMDACFTPSC